MGLIQAAVGALGGTLADQWKDFYTVPDGLANTSALFPAALRGTNAQRGSNQESSVAVITNGSRFVVPEGYVLITLQDGAITSVASQPGAYIWDSEDINAKSIFSGDSWSDSLIRQSWERFKFGGRPGSQQLAFFVNGQELPNNKFGTQAEIYWDDAFLNTQVGAITRGSYTLRIQDPVTFIRQFVPAAFLQNGHIFDFTDTANDQAKQLFSEVVSVLAAAFSSYTNDPSKGNRIAKIQQDAIGFADALSSAVEGAYQWSSSRGLAIEKVAIVSIEYDEATRELLKTIQRADALTGSRGNVNLQASVAAGIEAAGSEGGAAGIFGLGLAGGSIGLADLNQPGAQPVKADEAAKSGPSTSSENSLVDRLVELKAAFDSGLITPEEFQLAKQKLLGVD
jgi:membrane protease subunit (stomatin/prohibitin family)